MIDAQLIIKIKTKFYSSKNKIRHDRSNENQEDCNEFSQNFSFEQQDYLVHKHKRRMN